MTQRFRTAVVLVGLLGLVAALTVPVAAAQTDPGPERYKKAAEDLPAGWRQDVLAGRQRPEPPAPTPDQEAAADARRPSFRASEPDGALPGSAREPADHAQDRHIIVKYAEGTSAQARATARSRNDVEFVRRIELIGADVVVPRSDATSPQAAATALDREGDVEYADANRRYYPAAAPPDDPLFGELWGLHNTGQEILGLPGTPGVDVNTLSAWDATQGDEDVVVAVIDTGTDIGHPDLAGNIWTNPGEICANGVDDEGNGYVDDCNGWDFANHDNTVFDASDGDEHGTHVSGTIAAAAGNLTGVAGVAPNVRIMPVKFLGPFGGWLEDAILAIEYAAANGAQLSNNSWGGGSFEQSLKDAIEAAEMPFVAAAGNASCDVDQTPDCGYPAAFDSPNILSVAAIDNSGAMAGFSNYGETSVDVGAPGVEVLSTVPAGGGGGAVQNNQPWLGTGHRMVWGFGLEDVDGTTDRSDLVGLTLQGIGTEASASILLVDDDGSDEGLLETQGFYTDALSAAGYTDVTVHEVPAAGDGPSPAAMAPFDTVIWFTGDMSEPPPLTFSDESNLRSYLDGDGRLLLAGADAIWGNEWSELVIDYLDVWFLHEGVEATTLTGAPGFAYDGRVFTLSGADSGRPCACPHPSRDVLGPFWGDAGVALTYEMSYEDAYQYFSGTSMASPHAAGAIALLLSVQPDLTGEQVAEAVRRTSTPLASLEGKTVSGGMVDAAALLAFDPSEDIPGVLFPGQSGDTVVGEIAVGTVDSVYRLPLAAGELVELDLVGPPAADFDLHLFGPGATTVFSAEGLVAGAEGLTSIESITYRVPETGTYYIDVYAFSGSGPFTVSASWANGPGRYDNSDAAIAFGEHFATDVSDPSHWSASIRRSHPDLATTATSWAELSFYGPGVRYIAYKDPTYGFASVTVDGVPQAPVSLFADSPQYRQEVFDVSGLDPATRHTIRIGWAGQGTKRTATAVNLDSLRVRGPVPDVEPDPVDPDPVDPDPVDPDPVDPDPVDPDPVDPDPVVVACPPGEVPAAAFTDRGTMSPAHRSNVDCAAWRDIVSGFGDGSYRPARQVRRDQMASFIARTLTAAGVDLPAPGQERFTDVRADSPHAEAIHRLAAAGIVQGGPGGMSADAYGGDRSVRRDQMASFLIRAAEFAGQEALASQSRQFDDVRSPNTHFSNVNGAALAGWAQGFGDGTYRPAAGVRRDQMGTFVIRLLRTLMEGV